MNRKAALALGLCLSVVVTSVSACGARAAVDTATARPVLRISMRPTDTLSAFLDLPQFSVQAVPIGDAQKRLEALEKGSVDVASAVADVTYAAFYGRLPGHSAPLQKIRGIALMNRAVVHLLIGPKRGSEQRASRDAHRARRPRRWQQRSRRAAGQQHGSLHICDPRRVRALRPRCRQTAEGRAWTP